MGKIRSFEMILELVLILCSSYFHATATESENFPKPEGEKPHIITIIADDLGWNDVGFHGSNQIPTPNIDALAYNGVILNRHYTQPTCTPSRAALLTGKYPIRYGLQGGPVSSRARVALPLNETILPQYLKELGYVSRLVGKWHLGHYNYNFTPMYRGFDSHFGYYNGWIRYNDSVLTTSHKWGYDAWDNLTEAADRFKGKYATDVFTEEAVRIIKNHNTTVPLFLDLSHVAVHALNDNILQVRNATENDEKFAYIEDPSRRLFAGVLTALDESVGKVIAALDEKNMLKNSIILFISDNGGATEDNNVRGRFKNSASNWPLRGWKSSLTDGAVRGVAAIWSPLLNTNVNSVSDQLIHISDWLPTFIAAAGGDVEKLGDIDGVNQWNYLTGNQKLSARTEILLNINEIANDSAMIANDWKYIRLSANRSMQYRGVSGRDNIYSYSMDEVLQSEVHTILNKFHKNTTLDLSERFTQLRTQSTIDKNCKERLEVVQHTEYIANLSCFQTGCLFNIKDDPCEFTDLSGNEPKLRALFEDKLSSYQDLMVPQQRSYDDPYYDPGNSDHYWTPWVVYTSTSTDYSASYQFITVPNVFMLFMGGLFPFFMNYVHIRFK